MLLQKERELIVEYGQKLITTGLTKGTGGNISIYNPEKQLMAISPSGLEYFKTLPEDVVVLDLAGHVADGGRKPSSEFEMHCIFYRRRPNIQAVVHTHSLYAAVLACLHWNIEPTHYLIGFAGRQVKCTPYETFGTRELAEAAFAAMEDNYTVLLGNHGLLAVGPDIVRAFQTAEETEFCAQIYYLTKTAGQPVILSDSQMDVVLEKFKTYGQKER
ncbi:L-fuculose-phosphate aldolase [Acetonema longum]|uniref:Class II aldolase/adducin family protein n=1 Tax=Acetonema longum DSM 6540 TaxID=1009370 RepID=F7NGV9_9FIRM|nr:L-fuculose-phosphate aldolase [Acetonema longum]EGO64690.1 class II aldolase/adducin family protein [Acetonema longum DSM 6540]